MTVLHATEPASVYLALAARVDGLRPADIEGSLYEQRVLVKQLAMRRTLFVFPRDLLPAAWGSASRRVAGQLRRRLVAEVEAAGLATDGHAWLCAAEDAVLAYLEVVEDASAQDLRERLPELTGRVELAAGTTYGGSFPVAPRVLTQLAVEHRIVRGRNRGHWRTSRPGWTSMRGWLGEDPLPTGDREGWAELVRRWLGTFGPGTRADVQWWLGCTVAAVTRALADVGAVEVRLEDGGSAWVLPGDDEPTPPTVPWPALLPVLDPTTMGWKERGFYLGSHGARLFDRNGNAGTTAWWDGRVVGCWVQDPDASVRVELVEDVGREAALALDEEAGRLTTWLGGVKVGTVYPSPAMKRVTA